MRLINGDRWLKFLWAPILACTVLPAQGPNPPAPSFAVASIKPTQEAMQHEGPTPDGYSSNSVTVRDLIFDAFEIKMADLISGLPGWADTQRFAVEAKMDEETAAALHKLPSKQRDAVRDQMMQALLAERLKLKFHHQTRVVTVYALVLAKGGPKLKSSNADGRMNMGIGRGFISAKSTSLDDLADALSDKQQAGRVVLDRTGLTGRYDFNLRYAADPNESVDAGADQMPSLFTALEEQLGLKLQPVKAPVDTIVVDHIEPPTPD